MISLLSRGPVRGASVRLRSLSFGSHPHSLWRLWPDLDFASVIGRLLRHVQRTPRLELALVLGGAPECLRKRADAQVVQAALTIDRRAAASALDAVLHSFGSEPGFPFLY